MHHAHNANCHYKPHHRHYAWAGVTNGKARWQKRARLEAGKQRVVASLSARSMLCMERIATVHAWARSMQLPATLEAMRDNEVYAVPMAYERYPKVSAIVLTAKTQVGWILQLVAHPKRFAVHVDGKHKLHHGDWLLLTFGTHVVERRTYADGNHRPKNVHSFRPLVRAAPHPAQPAALARQSPTVTHRPAGVHVLQGARRQGEHTVRAARAASRGALVRSAHALPIAHTVLRMVSIRIMRIMRYA